MLRKAKLVQELKLETLSYDAKSHIRLESLNKPSACGFVDSLDNMLVSYLLRWFGLCDSDDFASWLEFRISQPFSDVANRYYRHWLSWLLSWCKPWNNVGNNSCAFLRNNNVHSFEDWKWGLNLIETEPRVRLVSSRRRVASKEFVAPIPWSVVFSLGVESDFKDIWRLIFVRLICSMDWRMVFFTKFTAASWRSTPDVC